MEYYQNNQLQYQEETGLLHTEDERQMGMFLHMSALANMIIPFAGYILPIVIWQTKKDQMPALVSHGKEAVNWMISSFIYNIVAIIAAVIGIFLIIAEIPVLGFLLIAISVISIIVLSIVSIIYAVYAGVKANGGEHWDYPLSIKFLK